jgi:hypothetical protein
MNNNLTTVEAACRRLVGNDEAITFTAIADQTGISRTTLYRNPDLRAVIDEHRHHTTDPRTLTALTTEIAHLRTGLEALGNRIRQQEERLRRLETPAHRKTS